MFDRMRSGWRGALVCTLTGCCLAAGQTGSPLAGPSVEGGDAETRPDSLVRVGYDGTLRELDAPPSIAAIRLLDLREDEYEWVARVLHERAALMDRLVLEHVLLLSEIEGVMTAGTPGEKLRVIMQGLEALKPARAWGKIEDRVRVVLPERAQDRYNDLILEYEATAYRLIRDRGETENVWQYRMMRHWQDLGWEIEQAAQRVLNDNGGEELTSLIEKLELDIEQESRVRTIVESWFLEVKGRPSKGDEQALFAKIMGELTAEQKLRLLWLAARGEFEKNKMDGP